MKQYLAFLFVVTASATAVADAVPSLQLVQTIPLHHVEGRIDHLAIDLAGQRLFVAALGNNSVEVIDLTTLQWKQRMAGLSEPQGVVFIPELHQVAITNGNSGTCEIYGGDSLERIRRIHVGDDADNIRYDAVAKQLYVGYGHGALAVIDATNGQVVGNIRLAGHPESFQLEPSASKIFVNIPGADQIAVVDRTQQQVVTTWSTTGVHANFPMALDEAHQRLFVGFRAPAKLVVFDTATGAQVASVDSVGDTDEVFYDVQRRRIYISGGEGFLQVVGQLGADNYQPLAKLPTAPGARTALFVPELNRVFLAVPQHGDQQAEIRIYDVQP